MKCPRCGRELIWGSDFDAEEMGREEPAIVSFWSCRCGVDVEIYTPEKNEMED